jgi:hypothetical protein
MYNIPRMDFIFPIGRCKVKRLLVFSLMLTLLLFGGLAAFAAPAGPPVVTDIQMVAAIPQASVVADQTAIAIPAGSGMVAETHTLINWSWKDGPTIYYTFDLAVPVYPLRL